MFRYFLTTTCVDIYYTKHAVNMLLFNSIEINDLLSRGSGDLRNG